MTGNCRASVCCSGVGCLGAVILVPLTLSAWQETSFAGRAEDFSTVAAGCLIQRVEMRRVIFCTSNCAPGRKRYRTYGFDAYLDISFALQINGTMEAASVYSYYLGRHGPHGPPPLPHSQYDDFEVGRTVPCWKANVRPVPALYRCGCKSWIWWSQCHDFNGGCAILRDPAEVRQEVKSGHLTLISYLVGLIVALTIACLAPLVGFCCSRLSIREPSQSPADDCILLAGSNHRAIS
mmetsp:Transcript_88085/g.285092  ORF Transcript_88085/g.285092 Transcript_88085/m.285092 type:complete len:236 (-) Transcript_88085:114-821(-)